MIYTYFDTSALAKAYLEEPGTERVQEVLRETRAPIPTRRAFVCSLGYPETVSAISVAERTGRVPTLEARRLMQRVDQDFAEARPFYSVLDTPRALMARAAVLVRRYRLRGFDAVHLAAALELRDAARGVGVELAATDARIVTAAEAESLALMEW